MWYGVDCVDDEVDDEDDVTEDAELGATGACARGGLGGGDGCRAELLLFNCDCE